MIDYLEYPITRKFPKELNGQGIYAIKHIDSSRVYVGSSKNIRARVNRHISVLKSNKFRHHSSYLQFAWDKYGEPQFSVLLLEIVEDEQRLIEKEQYWIDQLNSYEQGFNARPKAEANYGIQWSERQNEARRRSSIKTWSDPALRKKLSDRFSGERRGRWTKSSHEKASQSLKARHKKDPGWRLKFTTILSVPEVRDKRLKGVRNSLKNVDVYNRRVVQLRQASLSPQRLKNLRITYFGKYHRGKFGRNTIEEFELLIKELYDKGKSIREIGGMLEVDHKTIKRFIERLGISPEKRYRKGEDNHHAILSERQVREIKYLLKNGISQALLADHFSISPTVISEINNGKLWGQVQVNEVENVLSSDVLDFFKKELRKRNSRVQALRSKNLRQRLFEKHDFLRFGIQKFEDFEKECMRLYDEGNSVRQIAAKFELSHQVVSNILKKKGVAIEKQRVKGSRHSSSKLDEQKVRQIKLLIEQGVKQYEIARIFGVSSSIISEIKNGKTWKHV